MTADLDARIRTWIAADGRTSSRTTAALSAVIHLHREFRIFGECSHTAEEHELQEIDVVTVPEVGETCHEGYQRSVCFECCADDGHQTEDCATNHSDPCWPCSTHHVIARELGLNTTQETQP